MSTQTPSQRHGREKSFKSKAKKLSEKQIRNFQKKILGFYSQSARLFPWRKTKVPYRILLSEIMLQQTQTERVRGFYERFLKKYPTLHSLSKASLPEVLQYWSGLGYNRRARFLLEAAREVVKRFKGKLPYEEETLLTLPGIGRYTASAVAAFAFEKPTVFIETNIRTVYTHEFFKDAEKVSDNEIILLIAQTLYRKDIRSWYYALMDYGVELKKKNPGINSKSKHYRPQSKFKGSNREIRGKILKLLATKKSSSIASLYTAIGESKARVVAQLLALNKEGFLWIRKERVGIKL